MALAGKGDALLKLGRYEQAIPYFDKILAMNSTESSLLDEASKNKQLANDALKKQ